MRRRFYLDVAGAQEFKVSFNPQTFQYEIRNAYSGELIAKVFSDDMIFAEDEEEEGDAYDAAPCDTD